MPHFIAEYTDNIEQQADLPGLFAKVHATLGDSGVGHPLLDQSAFLHGVEPVDAATLRHEWARLWRATIPGSDPERAAALLAPVAAIRHAAVYQNFLDRIGHFLAVSLCAGQH